MNVLDEILALRKKQLLREKERFSLSDLEKKAREAPKKPDFLQAIQGPGKVSIIAEMKRRSPSAGLIRHSFDPLEIARAYEKAGVAAISVLTEEEKFGGRIDDLIHVAASVSLPILRKDFLFDPYQIIEARAFGASAVLLIADMLSETQLRELLSISHKEGLTPLVEVFTPEVVPVVLRSGARLVGINTRNLKTLEMKPENISLISKMIPSDCFIVAESGIRSASEIQALKSLEVSAALVGESLLRQADIGEAARILVEAGK